MVAMFFVVLYNWPYDQTLRAIASDLAPYVEERNGSTACPSFSLFRIVFFRKMQLFSVLEIKFQNGAHLHKGLFWTHLSHVLVTRQKTQNFLWHISLLHTILNFIVIFKP